MDIGKRVTVLPSLRNELILIDTECVRKREERERGRNVGRIKAIAGGRGGR